MQPLNQLDLDKKCRAHLLLDHARIVLLLLLLRLKTEGYWGRELLRSNLFTPGAQGAYALRARCHSSRFLSASPRTGVWEGWLDRLS